MKNQQLWRPTKFVMSGGRLRGSRDSEHVSTASRLVSDRIASSFERYLKTHGRGDLLDLGCGTVPLYEVYQPLVDSITCVDWPGSPHDVQHSDVLCDINEPLPLRDDSYDTVILSDVLEHLHNPTLVFGEIARVMRPGGKLLMTVPFMYGLHEQPHDYHRYTRFAISHLASRSGLRPIEIIELGGAGDVACNMVAKLFLTIPMIGGSVASFLQFTWYTISRIGFIRRMEARTATIFPFEYFAVIEKAPLAIAESPGMRG